MSALHRSTVRRFPSKEIEPGWVKVPGYRCHVTATGRVMGATRELAGWIDCDGYRRANVRQDSGRFQQAPVHTLVALAFHGPRPSARHEVAHGDGVRTNNAAGNLRWALPVEQYADRVSHGTHCQAGEGNWNAGLTNAQAAEIRRLYRPRSRDAGYPALGRRFGVSKFVIYRVIRLGAYA